jgi:hypothetical protein
VLLGVLAVWDLRVELQLLRDHPTWTSLAAGLWNHPLAVVVLLLFLPQGIVSIGRVSKAWVTRRA